MIYGAGMGLLEDPTMVEAINAYAIKLIIRGRLTHSSVTEVVRLADKLPAIRLSLPFGRPEADCITQLLAVMDEPDGGPTGILASRIGNLVTADALRFILPALVLGHDRVGVPAYAESCGIASRSLQESLQDLALPPPHQLLVWGQVCWMVWRMNRYGMNSKQAAVAGGFANASAMSAALTPVTGESPTNLAKYDSTTFLAKLSETKLNLQRVTTS